MSSRGKAVAAVEISSERGDIQQMDIYQLQL